MAVEDLHPEMHDGASPTTDASGASSGLHAPDDAKPAAPQGSRDYPNELNKLIEITVGEGASDLHFTVGYYPTIRVLGRLVPITSFPELTPEDTLGYAMALLSEEQQQEFYNEQEVDFSYTYNNVARFRGNGSFERGRVSIAMRLIPNEIKTISELNLPPILEQFTQRKQGFFLVVGPVGQGKSTTLASMIEVINRSRAERIVTIEDPIEYVYTSKESMILQREAKVDTHDFKTALRSALRQDVNVILVGEMRGVETIASGVTAAETGHLVFSTLHTNNAAQTIDRIIDSFPGHQQGQIRMQLAASLAGIFSQRLLPRVSGGRVPAFELLINNKAVANLIREKRTHEINTVIETSSEEGMISMNQSLADLVRQGEIVVEDAFRSSVDPKDLERLL